MSGDSLQDVELDLNVTDADGNPANGVFFVSDPTLSGALTAVDGTGILPAGSTGTVTYTFIPTDQAAPDGADDLLHRRHARVRRPGHGRRGRHADLPATITVDPQAELQLNYFLQQDVIGEDPFDAAGRSRASPPCSDCS